MAFTSFNPTELKRPTAVQLEVSGPAFKVFEDCGMMGWTNNALLDICLPRFVEKRVIQDWGEISRAPTLVPESFARTAGRLLTKFINADLGQLATEGVVELKPVAFEHEDGNAKGGRVILVADALKLAVAVDRRYFSYFATVHRGCVFVAHQQDLSGPLAVSQRHVVVGLISPLEQDGKKLYREVMRSFPKKRAVPTLSKERIALHMAMCNSAAARGSNAPVNPA